MATLIIHHNNDHDGVMSAHLLGRKYPDAIFFGYDYEDDPLRARQMLALAEKADRIFIIDLGQRPGIPTWSIIQRFGPKVTVIDHHKSTINLAPKIRAYGARFYGRTDRSTIGLVAEFTDQPLGPVLRSLEKYDMKGAYGEPMAVEFAIRALRSRKWKDPRSEFARAVAEMDRSVRASDPEYKALVGRGNQELEAIKTSILSQLRRKPGRLFEWRGKKILVVPISVPGPLTHELFGKRRDIEYVAVDTPERPTISVYAIRPGASVLDLVDECGGGGHAVAGGCAKNEFYRILKEVGYDQPDNVSGTVQEDATW